MKQNLKFSLLAITAVIFSCSGPETVDLFYNPDSPVISHGVTKFSNHLISNGISVIEQSRIDGPQNGIFILTPGDQLNEKQRTLLAENIPEITSDGYKIVKEGASIYIVGKTEKGCLYGIMDLIEQLGAACNIKNVEERRVNPAFSFRAIKFNLPWSPYRPGPATELHMETCRDINFWEAFLDMMVENRFNALTLWNTHPFPYLIRTKNFPEATPFSNEELNEWQSFWKTLFKMAKDRGIETYLVNWNIVVSPEFADVYGARVYDDRSELVQQYTRESVTQVINEYQDLTGLGVTLADWMGNWGNDLMTPTERENWIENTFVEGMNNADRKIKFIHRAVLAGDPAEMRRVIDKADLPDRTIVEVKFNWSHGHSTPNLSITHSNDAGTIMRGFWDPKPENYFIAWMIRNEDFFVLRWGDPEFIKAHISTNHHEYVDGYFVGSEGYIPAKDYSHKDDPAKTWNYAFEKQWLFYHLWGRLTFNPEESDETLAKSFKKRYEEVDGLGMLKAYSLASKVPLYLASYYKSTWDFTLYSEGFMAPYQDGYNDRKSPFISIEELIRHETLDSIYLSIREYCRQINDGLQINSMLITPIMLAQKIEVNCNTAMDVIESLRFQGNGPGLNSELDDLETWCYLGLYFADKLRAGVSLETYNLTREQQEKEEALEYLDKCFEHWEKIIQFTVDRYVPMPYVSMGHPDQRWPDFKVFHWNNFLQDVHADIDFVRNFE